MNSRIVCADIVIGMCGIIDSYSEIILNTSEQQKDNEIKITLTAA